MRLKVRLLAQGAVVWPGLVISAIVAVAALFLSEHYGAPVMLFALLMGMAVNFLSEDSRCQAGIEFVARHVLRVGVALLGLKITGAQIQAVGWPSLVMVLVAVIATIGFGIALAKLMGFQTFFGLLSGGAVGICGASAAMAISAAFPPYPQKERATLFVVISVSTLSTAAMVTYPLMARWLELDAVAAGFFLGASIHDVAQVVGAGYSMSAQIGDVATLVKLMRVAMLVPVIAFAAWVARAYHVQHSQIAFANGLAKPKRPPLLPGFALAFILLAVANSAWALPEALLSWGNNVSRTFLVAAMAAIGMKTHLKDVLSVGWQPVALMLAETVFLATLVLLMQWLYPLLTTSSICVVNFL